MIANKLLERVKRLRCLVNPFFWVPLIAIILVKLWVFHLAVTRYFEYETIHHDWSLFYFNMEFVIAEPYADFGAYYMNFVERFAQGYLPYTPDLYLYGDHQVYIYPPLFLYIIYAFYRIPFPELLFPDLRLVSSDLGVARVGFSFVFCDIVTCVIVFAAAKKLTANRSLPAISMLLFGLNPVALWWGDYMWMSTPIHTCFLTLGLYFLLDARLCWAAFWVTVAVMVKQTAAILLPVILMMELARGWKRFPISLGIMAAVGVTLSMPYLLLYPIDYLSAVTSGMGGYWMESLPSPTYPVPVSVLAWYLPPPLNYFIILLCYIGIPFVASLTSLSVVGWLIQAEPNQQYREQILVLALLISLSFHTFFSRGVYKYYHIALLPFLVLLIPALRGPLVPLRQTKLMDSAFSNTPLQQLPSKLQLALRSFVVSVQSVVNRLATWALLLVSFVSIAIFGTHRFVSPAILLSFFLFCLLAAWYHFDWKPRHRSKTENT